MAKQSSERGKYVLKRKRVPQLREDSPTTAALFKGGQPNLTGFDDFTASGGALPTSVSTVALHNGLRRYGIEGEDAFLVLASRYLDMRNVAVAQLDFFPLERGQSVLNAVAHDKQVMAILDGIVAADPTGHDLPTWYQFFFGRRFREGSGKFFTPRTVAAAMVRLLPVLPGAVVMDPTCGGGTFLSEASRRWRDTRCRLVGNELDRMLVGLTELVLALSLPPHHSFELTCNNIYDATSEFEALHGKVDGILANPPFSLPLEKVGFRSELFSMGYRNSDAVFLDVCFELLAPGGTLVCLLPHSLVVNGDTLELRKTVERNWELRGVVTLPEGVFYLSGNTTTRADIVQLRKRGGRHCHRQHVFFANAPTVGFPLNSRTTFFGENSLNLIVSDDRVQECVGNGK